MDKVTTDTHPTRSYRILPTENTDDAVLVYDTILSSDMVAESPDGDNPKAIEVVKEDVLENCWTAPPRLVISQTDTDSTLLSTVSGIIDSNKFPATVAPATQDDDTWDALVERTDALEKAAEDIAKMEKATKEALETQWIEVEEKHKAALVAAEQKQKD
eukprot:8318675-Ditylum_brightwellii.AAC.1